MHLDVLGQVVAPRELLLAHGALVRLHARVRAPVPGQLVRAREPAGHGGQRPRGPRLGLTPESLCTLRQPPRPRSPAPLAGPILTEGQGCPSRKDWRLESLLLPGLPQLSEVSMLITGFSVTQSMATLPVSP